MTESDANQLAGWASAVLDEVLVKAAIDIHKQDQLGAEVEVALTFTVATSPEAGSVCVISPGSRGKAINIEVPVPRHRSS